MDKAVEMLRRVHIPEPERRAQAYPHQLSGGMRQRAMIAMALSCNPKLLIADEPTTALDVTIQAQILELMRELQQTLGMAIILITHDMGVVAENADRVVVMYAGRKVEEASADDLFDHPAHPYTKGLLGSVPNLETAASQPGAARPAQRDQGHGALACRPAAGLQLCAALRLRHRRNAARHRRRSPSIAPDTGSPAGMPAGCREASRDSVRSGDAAAGGARPEKAFSDPRRLVLARLGLGLCGGRRVVPDRARARRWGWWARAAAASRRSAAPR